MNELQGALMELTLNKDINAISTMSELFNMTQQIFKYTGLPTTIPQDKLETILQRSGQAFIAEHKGALYAFRCSPGGGEDVYGDPTTYLVNNTALELDAEYKPGLDGVLMRNTTDGSSLMTKIASYAAIKAESDVTLNDILVKSRLPWTFIAKDDETAESIELMLEALLDGDMAVVTTDEMFSNTGVDVHSLQSGAGNITHVIELVNYLKSEFFSSLGINMNDNMKRQYVSGDELSMNEEATKPLVDNMLANRQRAIDEINAMFDLDIKVELTSAWHGHTEKTEEVIEETDGEETEIIEDHSHEAEVNETLEGDLSAGEVLDTQRLLEGEDAISGEMEEIVNEAKEIERGDHKATKDVLEKKDDKKGKSTTDETSGSDGTSKSGSKTTNDELNKKSKEEVKDEKKSKD